MATKIQFKRHVTNSNLPSDYILDVGEPFYMKNTNRLYVGDGVTGLGSLDYIGKISEFLVDSGRSKLTVGTSDLPVYFANGVPVACSSSPTFTGQIKINGGITTTREDNIINISSGITVNVSYITASNMATGELYADILTVGTSLNGNDIPTYSPDSPTNNAISKHYTDASTSNELSSSGTALVTERKVYYGLPTINDVHNYTSGTTIYAPTAKAKKNGNAVADYMLVSDNNGMPIWKDPTTITVFGASVADFSTVAGVAGRSDEAAISDKILLDLGNNIVANCEISYINGILNFSYPTS